MLNVATFLPVISATAAQGSRAMDLKSVEISTSAKGRVLAAKKRTAPTPKAVTLAPVFRDTRATLKPDVTITTNAQKTAVGPAPSVTTPKAVSCAVAHRVSSEIRTAAVVKTWTSARTPILRCAACAPSVEICSVLTNAVVRPVLRAIQKSRAKILPNANGQTCAATMPHVTTPRGVTYVAASTVLSATRTRHAKTKTNASQPACVAKGPFVKIPPVVTSAVVHRDILGTRESLARMWTNVRRAPVDPTVSAEISPGISVATAERVSLAIHSVDAWISTSAPRRTAVAWAPSASICWAVTSASVWMATMDFRTLLAKEFR